MTGQIAYLDSSFLVKRYAVESGSDKAYEVFNKAEKGELSLVFSEWNLGEVAVVFDKYQRKGVMDARSAMTVFLNDISRLSKHEALELYPLDSSIINQALKHVLDYHVYIADAVQLETFYRTSADSFWTSDDALAKAAKEMGIETNFVV